MATEPETGRTCAKLRTCVGASSGLGRCIGIGLAQRGAQRGAARAAARPPRSRGEGSRGRTRSRSSATSPTRRRADRRSPKPRPGSAGSTRSCTHRASGRWPGSSTPTPTRGGACSTRTSPAPRSSPARRYRRLTASGGHRGVPVVGQRVAHAAVARTRRVRGEQGRARQAGGGLARGAPARRVHARRRRRLRRWRRRRADAVRQRMGHRARGRARPRLDRPQLPQRFAHRRRPPRRPWSTRCCGAARRCRSRRSRSRRGRSPRPNRRSWLRASRSAHDGRDRCIRSVLGRVLQRPDARCTGACATKRRCTSASTTGSTRSRASPTWWRRTATGKTCSSAHGIDLSTLSKDPELIKSLPQHHHDGPAGARPAAGAREPGVHAARRRRARADDPRGHLRLPRAVRGRDEFDAVADFSAHFPVEIISRMLGVPEADREQIRHRLDIEPAPRARPARPDARRAWTPIIETGHVLLRAHGREAEAPGRRHADAAHAGDGRSRRRRGDRPRRRRDRRLRRPARRRRRRDRDEARRQRGRAVRPAPDQWQKILDDPEKIPRAVEEILRYLPPSQYQGRFSVEDREYEGGTHPGRLPGVAHHRRGDPRPTRLRAPRRVRHRTTAEHLDRHSGTACTAASAPRSRAWRAASRSRSCAGAGAASRSTRPGCAASTCRTSPATRTCRCARFADTTDSPFEGGTYAFSRPADALRR